VKRAVVLLAFVALAAPAGAAAHATLIRTIPADGAVVAHAPRAVRVEFDDTVRVRSGNAAVSNATSASILGAAVTAHGRTLVLPLRRGITDGDYSVRWSIVSDDGHPEQGVLAFAVGAGSASPHPVLGASTAMTWDAVVLRTLYYLGLLVGGGATIFGLLTRRLFGVRLQRPLAHLLFFSLLAVFLGGSGIVHAAPSGTRFALVLQVALVVSLAGGVAAALAPRYPRLLKLAGACSLALLVAPTLSGHALDRDQPRALSIPADVVHLASAAVWLGGLAALVYLVPRVARDDAERTSAAARFSSVALIAVAILGLTGLVRALTELSAVHQVWSTSYGRTLIVKTALFAPLFGVGWLNRTVLLGAFARLRRSALVEVAVITGIVIAVAVLTELRPGVATARVSVAPTPAGAAPVLPPRDAVVDARELGPLAVGVARTPGRATVTVLDSDGTAATGRSVQIDGTAAVSCGAGCYRASASPGTLRVTIDASTLAFDLPERLPDASPLLRTVTKKYRSSRTIVFDETLRSSPANAQTTRFTVVAPHRLSYAIRGGSSAVVIGARRWDRDRAGAPWLESQQTPLDVTQPNWRSPTNVHEIAPGELTFLDRQIPAWFHVTLARGLPKRVRMTAAAHFMVDRYGGFDVPAEVSPPPSR
jgi:copper transport protein